MTAEKIDNKVAAASIGGNFVGRDKINNVINIISSVSADENQEKHLLECINELSAEIFDVRSENLRIASVYNEILRENDKLKSDNKKLYDAVVKLTGIIGGDVVNE